MENKTDKPYSLQDAKEEVAIKEGFFNYNDAVSLGSYLVDSVAKHWAEKATEELRKENEVLLSDIETYKREVFNLKSIIADDMRSIKNYISEIERLKESNKELVEGLKDLTEWAEVLLFAKYSAWKAIETKFDE